MKKTVPEVTSNTEMVTISRAEYTSLLSELQDLKEAYKKLDEKQQWLLEKLSSSTRKIYGTSSEKSSEIALEQISFFNEAELVASPVEEEPQTTEVSSYKRKRKSGNVKDVLPENIPVEVVEHRLPETELACPTCETTMVEIGKTIRRTLVFIPAQAKIREDIYYTYGCPKCNKEGTSTPITKTPREACVLPGSYASPEAIAHIMTQKFALGIPLYRQEQELNRSGIMLSRQTMSNWILNSADMWLKPIYEELHRQLLQREILHADETTLQVLHEDGKKAQSKSYMWLYRTSGDTENPIVLFDYRPNRKAENAIQFLDGFHGYLHTDGFPGYHKLPEDITVVGCWAHARRKFDDAVNVLPEKDRPDSLALQGQVYCSKLFALEKKWADLSPEERYIKRLEQAKPVLDAMLSWANTHTAAPKSKLGIALHYLKEQWPYLTSYLKDGRLEISNNRAERSIKAFVIGRKNFLFANTPNGAEGSALTYSIIETAKENGLDPFRYLTWVFTMAPELSQLDTDWAKHFTPACAPDACKSMAT